MKKKLSTQTSKEEGNRSLLSKPPRRTYNRSKNVAVFPKECDIAGSGTADHETCISSRFHWIEEHVSDKFGLNS